MLRIGLVGCVALLWAATASAQSWADKMFQERSHDFGAVPRAAKVEYEFMLTNLYKDDVHIVGVRSSCGCTQPRVEKDTLKSWEKGAIVCRFNTQAFSGQRGARVTVTIDRPQYAEVELQVRGYIRTDVVLDPSEVNLGSVAEGKAAGKSIHIQYAGRDNWKITGATTNSPYLTASVREASRSFGRVDYELDVQLKEGAPAGYLKDEIMLTTNDRRSTEFPVIVEGRIVPELAVSPSTLMFGTLHAGQKATKQIVVKAAKPFRIKTIRCDSTALKFTPTGEAKTVHLIPVTFEAADPQGKMVQKIEIVTDLNGGATAELSVTGQVVAPLAEN